MRALAILLLAVPLALAQPGDLPLTAITIGGPTAPDGKTEVAVDLPLEVRLKNIGGSDGSGLCVFTSIAHSSRWQNEPLLSQFQAWMKQHPGGGYPEKVDRMIAQISKEKGVKPPDYIQYQGNDPTVLKLALKTDRLPSVTYCGRDPHYRGQSVAHMVNLVYLDDTQACVLDNNFIGENELVWMSAEEFLSRWKGGQQGWAVILLTPPPPPPPYL